MNAKSILIDIKVGDFISFTFSIAVIVLLLYFNSDSHAQPNMVEVRNRTSTWLYPLDSDTTFRPLEENGTCLIEIRNNRVKVLRSNCPLKICISMGEISKSNQWIACLPHNVFISIIGRNDNLNNDSYDLDGSVY